MRWSARWIVLLLALLTFTACEASEPQIIIPTEAPLLPTLTPTASATPTPQPTPTLYRNPRTIAEDPINQVYLRFVHAAPEIEAVNFLVERLAVATNLVPGTASARTGLEAGTYTLRVVRVADPAASAPLLEQPIQLRGGDTPILILTGTTEAPALAIVQENNAPLNAGESRISFVNTITNSPELTVQQNGLDLTRPFGEGVSPTPVVVNAGDSRLVFLSDGQTILEYAVTLRERFVHTLILVGAAEDLTGINVIAFDNRVPGRTSLRIVNASPDAGSVDIYLNSTLFVSGIGYTRASERQNVASGTFQVGVYPAGSDPTAVTSIATVSITTAEDSVTSLVIMGSLPNVRVARVIENLSPVAPSQARIVFVNALETARIVRVGLSGGPIPGVPDLNYQQASPSVLISAVTQSFYWTQVDDPDTVQDVEIAENVQLEAGRSYLYLMTGRLDQPPLILSESISIDPRLADVPSDATAMPTSAVPVRVRLINAIDSAPLIDFLLGESVIVSGLAYRQATEFYVIPGGIQVVSIRNSTTQSTLALIEYDFGAAGDFSIYGYGFEDNRLSVLPIRDNNMDVDPGQNARLRLVNLTQDANIPFGLGYIPSSGGSSVPQSFATNDGTGVVFRPSLFLNTARLGGTAPGESATLPALLFPGQIDLIVIDPLTDTMAAIFPNIVIDSGRIYEMIVYQELFTSRVNGFILTYPPP